jgi:hypothetical protein
MRATTYHAVPAVRCCCPSKVFRKARDALRYARKAAETFRGSHAVWRVRRGTLRLVKRFPAPGPKARLTQAQAQK